MNDVTNTNPGQSSDQGSTKTEPQESVPPSSGDDSISYDTTKPSGVTDVTPARAPHETQNLSHKSLDTRNTTPHKTTNSSLEHNQVASIKQNQPTCQISIEQQLQKSKRDLESMVIKYAKSEQENIQNKNKVDELDKKLKRAIRDNDSLANRIKLLTQDKNQLLDSLNAKVAQLTVLEQKNSCLNSVQGVKIREFEEKINQLENDNEKLLKQIETYKSKEGELLDFSERLSMKHMLLQTELEKALEQAPDYRSQYEQIVQEKDKLIQENEKLLTQVDLLNNELKYERGRNESLRADRYELEVKYRRNVEELENEIKVMRRKHQIATKELLKQLKQMQAKLDVLDAHNNKILTA